MSAAGTDLLTRQVDGIAISFRFAGGSWSAMSNHRGVAYIATEMRFAPRDTPDIPRMRLLVEDHPCNARIIDKHIVLVWRIEQTGVIVSVRLDEVKADVLFTRFAELLHRQRLALADIESRIRRLEARDTTKRE